MNMERWHAKTAVVTGAGEGIGAAIATALADAGVRVVGFENNPQLFENTILSNSEGFILRYCDIAKPDEVAAEFKWIEEQLGGVHILVNNAGVLYQGQITEMGSDALSEDQILSSLDTNIKGTVLCVRHAVASMKRNHFDGHIININGLEGHYLPFSDSTNVYASTKYAVTAFTESLRSELAHFGSKIKTTSISPGLTNTRMGSPAVQVGLPALQPTDIADAVRHVLSTPQHVNNTILSNSEGFILRYCDIAKPDEVAAEFKWIEEQLGGVHILVNNAGVLYQGQITEMGSDALSEDQILSSLDTKIKGTVLCARHAVASMKRNHFDGHIININGLEGHYLPFSDSTNVYASTKYAVTAFTESLRSELAHFGSKIKTTSISPGLTNTRMGSPAVQVGLPALQPTDIADAVRHVLSTPQHVNISELSIQPVMEKRL